MKTYYKILKNGILVGEYGAVSEAFERARTLEGSDLTWKDGEDKFYAFGKTKNGLRTEYEVTPIKRRA